MYKQSKWLDSTQLSPQDHLRLFCFPYAGGAASSYRQWSKQLPPFAKLCPIELPGRGRRYAEPCETRMEALIHGLAEAILPYLDRPFAFFGHSMGALISYELAYYLEYHMGLIPEHLFLSAHSAPYLPRTTNTNHQLPDDALIQFLWKMGGTPNEVLQNSQLLELILPILRADFEMCETYRSPNAPSLSASMSVLGGLADPIVNQNQLAAWQKCTRGSFFLQMFAGTHFFIHSTQGTLLSNLGQQLEAIMTKSAHISSSYQERFYFADTKSVQNASQYA
ncbi:MAG: thioesterase domain-containing protein [Chloroflexota bacterium]